MSYCRFSDDSDVYAYECDGGVQFWVACNGNELDRLCNTFNEAYQYAKALRDEYGLHVPSYAINLLKAEAIEEAKRINGPNSAIDELLNENAKLRELVDELYPLADYGAMDASELDRAHDLMRELGVEVDGD